MVAISAEAVEHSILDALRSGPTAEVSDSVWSQCGSIIFPTTVRVVYSSSTSSANSTAQLPPLAITAPPRPCSTIELQQRSTDRLRTRIWRGPRQPLSYCLWFRHDEEGGSSRSALWLVRLTALVCSPPIAQQRSLVDVHGNSTIPCCVPAATGTAGSPVLLPCLPSDILRMHRRLLSPVSSTQAMTNLVSQYMKLVLVCMMELNILFLYPYTVRREPLELLYTAGKQEHYAYDSIRTSTIIDTWDSEARRRPERDSMHKTVTLLYALRCCYCCCCVFISRLTAGSCNDKKISASFVSTRKCGVCLP